MIQRLAILCDYAEENWPSMDLVAEMLYTQLHENHSGEFDTMMLRPQFKRRLSFLPKARIADRLINRMRDYPKWLAKRVDQFDLFHIADHSYSQLVHVLPADRTGVFCHDLDTFRCLLDPKTEPRPQWFRAMARRILCGMQKARVVFHSTIAIREQILKHGLLDPARLIQAPLGIAPEFDTTSSGVALPPQIAGAISEGFLLHVGSCIPRKRIDVLLDVFAEVSKHHPNLRLIQVGGKWTRDQSAQISRRKLAARLTQLSGQPRAVIAELYRRCRMVLLPSESEGFGLPIIEALACGATVLASDISVLREVGGDAVVYEPLADIPRWAARIDAVLAGENVPAPEARAKRAARYSWAEHAGIIARTYRQISRTGTENGMGDQV